MFSKNEQKFICQSCGSCCSKIRGRLSKEEREFLKEYAYGKMPLIQLIPLEKTSFPLWDWEAKRFREYERELNIDAKIKPSRAVYDLNTNKAIIVTYYMDYDSCPFLKDKRCQIYDKKRAYICKLFPMQRSPFLNIQEEAKPNEIVINCPGSAGFIEKIPYKFKDMVKALHEALGDTFLNSVENDFITEWVNKTIVDICKKYNIVRPAVNYPYNNLLKRIDASEKIDFTEFLVENKIYTKEEMDELIRRFDNCDNAKEKMKEFLNNKIPLV